MFTNKEEIAIGVKQELTKSMTGFGYAIIQARKLGICIDIDACYD